MKKCCRCLAEKPVEEFGINRANRDGRQSACSECIRKAEPKWNALPLARRKKKNAKKAAKDRERLQGDKEFQQYHVEKTRQWRKENPESVKASSRRSQLKTAHGLTEAGYKVLFDAQNGKCFLCGDPPGSRGLFVDHDHATGRIRGLLCLGCNTGLGMLGDNAAGLERALAYVQEPEQQFEPLTFVA